MLEFKLDDTVVPLIMTLSENVTISDASFLFVFRHLATNDIVTFVKTQADDESNHTERYNQFTIDPSSVFAGKQAGQWNYTVYEQLSTSNVDPHAAVQVVEYGKLIINRPTDFSFSGYEAPTSFKVYNG